ncbi:sugar isomerase domain-containing protein [Ornithinimicrobium cavernae]|uniref:sugar isomerase domain-containing protein n=1 Tax=Ornithinimicrobium cavernae TaxID=2666047 RepID=UPI000D68E73C|nr:sugar isomerase domain-containing protein [Ornithinimicrobium cavernae]
MARVYREKIAVLLEQIENEESSSLDAASDLMVEQVKNDRLIHVYGPGGHANLATQEAFFRAGGLIHISAILDSGTLLSDGALRSMAMERTPGYGRVVIDNEALGPDDLIVIVNSYGMNSAVIDAATRSRERGARTIGVSSRGHALAVGPDHPARHPTKKNLHDIVDVAIDSKVPLGDAVIEIPGFGMPTGAVSTYVNAFVINLLSILTVAKLVAQDVEPPVWMSGNAPGGDEANARYIEKFRRRVRLL